MIKQLLVYGSLRKARENNRFLRNCEFVEEVRVPGYDLYALGWYPGIKPNQDNKDGIVGEVYTLPDDEEHTIKTLDMYEGFVKDNPGGSLFIREEIEVKGEPTYVYVYNGRTDAQFAAKVPSGDWNHGRE